MRNVRFSNIEIKITPVYRYNTKFYHTKYEYQEINLPEKTIATSDIVDSDCESRIVNNIEYFDYDDSSTHFCYEIAPVPQTIYAIFEPNYFLSHWETENGIKFYNNIIDDGNYDGFIGLYRNFTQDSIYDEHKYYPVYKPH